MNSSRAREHFVTLFDSKFLPMGMALHSSLMSHAQPFHLWILCMDELVENQLRSLSLSNVTLIPLDDAETKELLEVKPGRTAGEYCWTMTSFTPQFVFERDPNVERVTYLDADLFFFDDPKILLDEFSQSGKHVLITDHAFAPEYYRLRNRGRFCVQFMTFRKTPEGEKVMNWWQDRCIEWCYARLENGKFGDQMYLDNWPSQFGAEVHILSQTDRTLAPWNVAYVFGVKRSTVTPVFFHFHGFRIISNNKILFYRRYWIGPSGQWLYSEYSDAIVEALSLILQRWKQFPILPERRTYFDYALRFIFRCLWRIQYRDIRL
jgi:hypothetical protein